MFECLALSDVCWGLGSGLKLVLVADAGMASKPK
jgi:hypothetical protein